MRRRRGWQKSGSELRSSSMRSDAGRRPPLPRRVILKKRTRSCTRTRTHAHTHRHHGSCLSIQRRHILGSHRFYSKSETLIPRGCVERGVQSLRAGVPPKAQPRPISVAHPRRELTVTRRRKGRRRRRRRSPIPFLRWIWNRGRRARMKTQKSSALCRHSRRSPSCLTTACAVGRARV